MRSNLLLPVAGLTVLCMLCSAALDGGSAARVAAARTSIKSDPVSARGYIELAAALCRQARDADDLAAYDEAGAALDRALQLSPGNFDALKLRVAILLGRHDFREALGLATELNHKIRDDISLWGDLVDANLALGDYSEAEKDAQWILDLRRGSTLGFVKAAALREMFGDAEGAIEFYEEALLRTPGSDLEERSWLMTQNARLQLASGDTKRAGALLEKALASNPQSLFTAAQMASLEASQGDYAAAAKLCSQVAEKAPHATNLYRLAKMLERAGQASEAEAAFQKFEAAAITESTHKFNANRDLVFYFADRRNSPAEALAIAVREAEVRHDSATLDAYAWALFRSGRFAEAKTQMDLALSPGVREGSYICHALRIATAVRDADGVRRFEKDLAGMPATVCPVSADSHP